MTKNNLFIPLQRTVEYKRSQYIGAIDILEEATKTTGEVRDLRAAIVQHYRTAYPKLMGGLDNISSELGSIASSIEEVSNTARQTLTEVQISNQNLIHIEATLDAGFELVGVRLEEGNRLLGDIANILSSPVATQAAEYLSRANNYLRDGFFEEAEEDFRKVVELDKGNYCAWYLIGLIRCQNAGDREGAISAFKKCDRFSSIRSKYYYSRSLFEQALLYYRVDNSAEKAIAALKLSIEADHENFQSHFFTSELLAASGKLEEAKKHLNKCVNADVIYFLKSASSKDLVESGLHNRLFGEKTEDLYVINRTFSKILESSIGLSDNLLDWSDGAVSLESGSKTFVSLFAKTPADDYLAQRELQRVGKEIAGALQENILLSNQWLQNHLEGTKRMVDIDALAVDKRSREEVTRNQKFVALVVGSLIGGGLIVAVLIEIVKAFQTSIIDGILATILVGIFGVVFVAMAGLVWASISGVLVGIISLFGKFRSAAVQSEIRAVGKREIAKNENSVKTFNKRLDDLKTSLAPFRT